jgi:hypothetical protein
VRRWFRLRALGGIVGPAAFTAAWAVSTARQDGYSIKDEHISGLAAPDARDPAVMIAGFLVLGAGTIAAGSAIEDALGGWERAGWGPRLIQVSGMAGLLAGVLRRDRMLLSPPDGIEGQSWRNDGHDVAAGVVYLCLVAAPIALAARFRDDPVWGQLITPAVVASAMTLAALAVFASQRLEPWNGIVQRAMVTLPGAGLAALSGVVLARGSVSPPSA